jgi:hypothetical protein
VLVAVALAALMAAPATWATETLGHATSSTFPTGGPEAAEQISNGSGGGPGGGPRGGFGGDGGFRGGSGGFAPPPGGAGPLSGDAPGGAGGVGMFGGEDSTLKSAINYAKSHGGGTIGVESQSTAAVAILNSDADVSGIGGFSGRESSVTASWIASEVSSGRLRWVLVQGSGGMAMGETPARAASRRSTLWRRGAGR